MTDNKKFLFVLISATLVFNCLIVLLPGNMPTSNFVFRFIGMMDTPGIGLYEFFKGEGAMQRLTASGKLFKIGLMTFGTSIFWVLVRNIIIVIKSRSSLR